MLKPVVRRPSPQAITTNITPGAVRNRSQRFEVGDCPLFLCCRAVVRRHQPRTVVPAVCRNAPHTHACTDAPWAAVLECARHSRPERITHSGIHGLSAQVGAFAAGSADRKPSSAAAHPSLPREGKGKVRSRSIRFGGDLPSASTRRGVPVVAWSCEQVGLW